MIEDRIKNSDGNAVYEGIEAYVWNVPEICEFPLLPIHRFGKFHEDGFEYNYLVTE